MVAVEKCANFGRAPSCGGQLGLAACSACAGDYEDPDATAATGKTQTDSGESSETLGAVEERMEEEEAACEQTDEKA